MPLGSDQVGPLVGIDEDVAYSAGDANALSAACRASASLIEGQAGSRSSAVSTAKTHFKGRFSRLFSDNASVQAADATNLVTALRDVATKVDALTEEARKVILGVSWVISGGRYGDGPLPWGIMGVKDISP